jgi:predicted HAD superfamily Cof-like phosphohydrolase
MKRANSGPRLETLFNSVEDFHTAFKVTENRTFDLVEFDLAGLRYKLLEEENREYLEACAAKDKKAIADALTDMMYVLIGTMRVHGFEAELMYKCFAEVHRSNMSKLDENGKPVYRLDGKILKSQFYSPPALQPILTKYESEQ